MPSWNIHIAQTERLLARDGAVARAVADRNAFLFGNFVPDILVGYMVPGVEEPIPYRITHHAVPEHIPKPREAEFWELYLASHADELRARAAGDVSAPTAAVVPLFSIDDEREAMNRVHYPQRYADGAAPVPAPADPHPAPTPAELAASELDLVLGAWAHLLADRIWNLRVNEYLDAIGDTPNEQFRVRKQTDFDVFGRTLPISAIPQATERLLAAAEAFPQYPIARRYALETVGVAHEIVRSNGGHPGHAPYLLLTEEFFERTIADVVDVTDRLLADRLG